MDALTAANTLATIIQLLGLFKQERQGGKDATHQEFMEWLAYHRHEALANQIANTAGLQVEISRLIQADTAAILKQLDCINTTLAGLLSRLDRFHGISSVLLPGIGLSEQGVSLITELASSGTRNFIYDSDSSVFLEASGQLLTITEPLFLGDDMEKLVTLGLLREQPTDSETYRVFSITRAGAQFAALQIPPQP